MNSFTTKKQSTQKGVLKKLHDSVIPLAGAIRDENLLLENGKLSRIKEVQEKKIQCLQNLNEAELGLEHFIRNNILDKSDPSLTPIKEALLELGKLSAINDILLKASIEASSKIIEFYKEVYKTKVTKSYNYNNQGNIVVSKNLKKNILFS